MHRMNRPITAEILILADQEPTAERWAAMLKGPENRIWLAVEDLPDPDRLDLILTDRNGPAEPQAEAFSQWHFGQAGPHTASPGVIRIGAQGPGDVRLPADVTERELRLACRLLAEVVRLRRKEHARTETHRRLAEEALTDPLTGLPNRRAWDRALRERLATTADSPGRLCLAILDLDHFKRINDTYGHAAGDDVLRRAGKVIGAGLRESDFVARLGGDEFGLLLSVPDEATAEAVVDRVRSSLPSGLARNGTHAVTASAGFQLTPSRAPTAPLPSPDALFIAADAALREAKHQGRDRVMRWEWGGENRNLM